MQAQFAEYPLEEVPVFVFHDGNGKLFGTDELTFFGAVRVHTRAMAEVIDDRCLCSVSLHFTPSECVNHSLDRIDWPVSVRYQIED